MVIIASSWYIGLSWFIFAQFFLHNLVALFIVRYFLFNHSVELFCYNYFCCFAIISFKCSTADSFCDTIWLPKQFATQLSIFILGHNCSKAKQLGAFILWPRAMVMWLNVCWECWLLSLCFFIHKIALKAGTLLTTKCRFDLPFDIYSGTIGINPRFSSYTATYICFYCVFRLFESTQHRHVNWLAMLFENDFRTISLNVRIL